MRLMELTGTKTETEMRLLQEYGEKIAILANKIQSLAEVGRRVGEAGAAPEATGRSYDALIAKLDVYKKDVQDTALQLEKMGISLNTVTQAETKYRTTIESNKQAMNTNISALQEMLRLRKTIGEKKETLVNEKEINVAAQSVNKLNIILEKLGLQPLRVDTKQLSVARKDMDALKTQIITKVKEIQRQLKQAFAGFEVDLKIQGLDAKESQVLQDITQNLKVMGAEQLKAGHSTELHNKRVQELNKAFVVSQEPHKVARQFLEDEVRLGKQRVAQLNTEIRQSAFPVIAKVKENIESAKLLRTTSLLEQANRFESSSEKERAKITQNLTSYVKEQNIESSKSAGRYKGVAQAVQSFTSDIKNLIQVQLRWYVTQALLFNTFYLLKNAITFYMDLENQVRRVSSALAHQYNIAAINAKIMSVLTKEMVRTGMAAQDLATILWELVSAGLSHQEAMAGVEHINNLAIGSELELSETTRITAGLFRMFGDEITQAGSASDKWRYIVDRLSATLNQSQVDMSSLTAGLSYLVNEADTAGVSFEQVLGILSVLNNRMLMGSKAGRSASRVLSQLTGNAKELSKSFGIEIDMSKPIDLLDILEKMSVVLKRNQVNGQVTAQTFDKLQDVFGQVGKRAAIGLIDNLEELKDSIAELKTDKFDDFAEKMANIKLDSLSKQIAILSNKFKILMSESLTPVAELLRSVVDLLNKLASGIVDSSNKMEESFIGTILKLGLIITLLKGVAWLAKKPVGGVTVLGTIGFAASFLGSVISSLLLNIPKLVIMIGVWVTKNGGLIWSIKNIGFVLKYFLTTMEIALTRFQVIGLVVTALVAGYFLFNKILGESNTKLRESNQALDDAKGKNEEAKQKYVALRDAVQELAEQYKNTIPYTREWYRVRTQLNELSPGLLTNMEVELALTGELTKALEEYLVKKREEIQLKEKAATEEAAIQDTLKDAAERAKTISDALFNQREVETPLVEGAGSGDILSNWINRTKEVKSFNKGIEDLTKSFDELYNAGRPIPMSMVSLLRSFDAMKSKASGIYDIIDGFERMQGVTGEVSTSLLELISRVKKDFGGQFGEIEKEIQLNATLSPESINKIIKELSRMAFQATDKDFINGEALDNAISRLNDFKKRMNNISETTKSPITVIKEFEAAVEDMSSNLPPQLEKMLIKSGEDLASLYRNGLAQSRELLNIQGDETLKAAEKIKIGSKAVERYYETLIQFEHSRVSSSILGMEQEVKNGGDRIFENAENLSNRYSDLYTRLSTNEKEELLSKLGIMSDVFQSFIKGSTQVTSEQFTQMNAKILESAKSITSIMSDKTFIQVAKMNDLLDTFDRTSMKMLALGDAMAKLGSSSGLVMKGWIEENQKYVSEATSYLPRAMLAMVSKATALEKLEMIKAVRETRTAINDEVKGLGIPVPEPIRAEIAMRKYREMFDKMSLSSKTFYEDQNKASLDFASNMVKNLENIGTTYSSVSANNIEAMLKQREVEKKYEEESMKIAKSKESLKLMVMNIGELSQYDQITENIKKYRDELEKTDTTLKRVQETQDLMRRSNVAMGDLLSGQVGNTQIEGIMTKYYGKVFTLVTSADELIAEEFDMFMKGIDADQRKYIEDLLKAVMKYRGISDPKQGALIIKTMLSALKESQKTSFEEGIGFADREYTKMADIAETKSGEINAKLYKAEESLTELMKGISESRLQTLKEYQALELQERYHQLQKGLELDAIEKERMTNQSNRLKSIYERALTRAQNFMTSYNSVMTFKEFGYYLAARVDAEKKLFDTERNAITKQIEFYKKEAARFLPVIETLRKQLKSVTEKTALPDYTVGEEMQLGRLDLLYKDATTRWLRYVDERRTVEEELRKSEEDDDVEGMEKQRKRLAELASLEKEAWDISGKATEEAYILIDRARERSINDTKHNMDVMLEKQKLTNEQVVALGQELMLIAPRAAQQYTKEAEESARMVIDRIKTYMESEKIQLQAKFLSGKYTTAEIEGIVTSVFEPQFDAFKKSTQQLFFDAIDSIQDMPEAEKEQAKDYLTKYFISIYTDSYSETKDYLRTYLSDISETMLGDVSKTKPYIDVQFETRGFGTTSDEIEKMKVFGEELKEIEKAKIPVLREEITKYREMAQEAAKQLPILAKQQEDAIKIVEGYKKLADYYESIGLTQTATWIRQQLLTDAINDSNMAGQKFKTTLNSWNVGLDKLTAKIAELKAAAVATANPWEKAKYGMEASWEEFKTSATDAFKIAGDLTNTFLEGFSTAMSDTMTAIFQPPAQEIEDAKTELDNLYTQKEDIAKKMELIKVGGVGADEVEEYNNLRKQLEDVNEQLRIARGNLDDLKSTAKRVGEAFRQFGKTILDALQQVIAKMLVMWMIESAMSGLSSIFGGGFTTKKSWVDINYAKGGIIKGGFKKFEKGGIAEGGFTSLDKTQKASWTPFLQNMMKAKFLQSGGVTRGPMLGVIGEGSRNEAVVPLPDNKSIPVSFTNDKKMQAPSQDVKIVNLIDPKMVPSIMLQYPEAILNVISEDVLKRGPIYQLLRKV